MTDDRTPADAQVSDEPKADEQPDPQTDYEAMTVEDLRTLSRERGLQVSGSKDELVARHEVYDIEGNAEEVRAPEQDPTNAPDSVPAMAGAVRTAIQNKNDEAADLRQHGDGDDPLGAIRAPGDNVDMGFGVDPLKDIRAPGDNVKIAENVEDPLREIRAPGAKEDE